MWLQGCYRLYSLSENALVESWEKAELCAYKFVLRRGGTVLRRVGTVFRRVPPRRSNNTSQWHSAYWTIILWHVYQVQYI